ncbi:MAG: hypothetical protein SGILL_000629 [Bacillariaceae sp.]
MLQRKTVPGSSVLLPTTSRTKEESKHRKRHRQTIKCQQRLKQAVLVLVVSLSVLTFTLWDVWETEVVEGKDWVKAAKATQPIMSPREQPQQPQPKAKYDTEENDDQVATQRMRRGRPRMMGMEGYESQGDGRHRPYRPHGQRRDYQDRYELEEGGNGDDETEHEGDAGSDMNAGEESEAQETNEENGENEEDADHEDSSEGENEEDASEDEDEDADEEEEEDL